MDRTHSIRFANTNKKRIESGILRPIRFYPLCLGGGGVEDTYASKDCGENDSRIALKIDKIDGHFDNPPPICPPMVIPE